MQSLIESAGRTDMYSLVEVGEVSFLFRAKGNYSLCGAVHSGFGVSSALASIILETEHMSQRGKASYGPRKIGEVRRV